MKKMLLMISAAVLLMAFTAGAVTDGTYYALGLEGTLQASSWFTFEYTEIETTPARYAQMINSFLWAPETPITITIGIDALLEN